MALITSPTWGELSGKLGGNIFARNGHGSYVRKYTPPVSPNTTAVQEARDSFATAVNLWQQMNGEQKTKWNEYAKTLFKPRTYSRTRKNSGFDAFMSLKQVQNMIINQDRTVSYELDGLPVTSEGQTCDIDLTNLNPPTKAKTTIMQDMDGNLYKQNFFGAVINGAGEGLIEIKFGDGDTIYKFQDNKDANGNWTGYILYCSEAKQTQGGFYATPLAKAIAYVWPFQFSGLPTLEQESKDLTINLLSFYDTSRFKEFPQPDEFVLLTLYAVDCYGQMDRVGSQEIQISF